jgi:hypothetical protein
MLPQGEDARLDGTAPGPVLSGASLSGMGVQISPSILSADFALLRESPVRPTGSTST